MPSARVIIIIIIMMTSVVPIVVGALGTVTNNLGKHLKMIGVTATVELLQKATLLGTARILRKVLKA